MNDYVINYVLGEYYSLGNYETSKREVCPACKGGSSKEKTFSVTRRDDLLLWNCFRASCPCSGYVSCDSGLARKDFSPRKRTRVQVATEELGEELTLYLSGRFGVPDSSLSLADLSWTGECGNAYERRVAYPIYGPDSRPRGAVFRSYEGRTPKSLTQLNDGALGMAWYKWVRSSKILVLTEDQMSAIKLAPHYHAAALLGTELTDAKVAELRSQNYERIYLALDRDATMEALRSQHRLRNELPNLLVLPLPKDVKDMDEQDLTNLLRRLI